MTQQERIVRHLRDYGSITSLEAMKEYGVMRLASRVSDLKKSRLSHSFGNGQGPEPIRGSYELRPVFLG